MKYFFRIIAKLLSKWNIYIVKSLVYDNKSNRRQIPINLDYVRYKTLELCSHEIYTNNVKGNVAELGVYKGDFAARINLVFQDRKLYLFDTFQGFDARDTGEEKVNEFSSGDQDFSDTNIELVLKKMKFPENCIVKKGYFPESAVDVNDIFVFVSLDADLYKPILAGLEFFYPRLEKGGYIFVHDFSNRDYKGAREAVVKFCKENQIGYTPIPDFCGSVVIGK
jgi:O-methyltransferase